MSQLDSTKPPSYKEATSQQVCVDAMIEEYNSIMKNDVWEVAPRPTEKLHYLDGSYIRQM